VGIYTDYRGVNNIEKPLPDFSDQGDPRLNLQGANIHEARRHRGVRQRSNSRGPRVANHIHHEARPLRVAGYAFLLAGRPRYINDILYGLLDDCATAYLAYVLFNISMSNGGRKVLLVSPITSIR
jgi:hypothetical protein